MRAKDDARKIGAMPEWKQRKAWANPPSRQRRLWRREYRTVANRCLQTKDMDSIQIATQNKVNYIYDWY